MDIMVVLEYLLKGSPWALVALMGYALWQIKGEYSALIQKRDDLIQRQEAKIQELHLGYKQTILDQSVHMESSMRVYHLEISQLQEKHTCAIMEMQRESIKSAALLNATLVGLIEAIKASGD